MSAEIQRHHLLYCRTAWEAAPSTRKLRQEPSLIIPMFADIEQDLHDEITTVPVLDYYTAQGTYKDYRPATTYTGSINRLLVGIDRASRHRKATVIQRRLAELTMYAIESQIPYIRQGQLTNTVGGNF